MFKGIERFLSFAVKLFAFIYILTWVFEKFESLLEETVLKWKTRGIDPRELKANEMELYYMEYGRQCVGCRCWIPAELDVCPVCGRENM